MLLCCVSWFIFDALLWLHWLFLWPHWSAVIILCSVFGYYFVLVVIDDFCCLYGNWFFCLIEFLFVSLDFSFVFIVSFLFHCSFVLAAVNGHCCSCGIAFFCFIMFFGLMLVSCPCSVVLSFLLWLMVVLSHIVFVFWYPVCLFLLTFVSYHFTCVFFVSFLFCSCCHLMVVVVHMVLGFFGFVG